jgi:dTDP-4-dehydrorhamnose reductase
MKTVLITGSAGNLAREIIKELKGKYFTIGIDMLSSDADISHEMLLSDYNIEKILDTYAPDVIIHLAGTSKPGDCQKDVLSAMDNNFKITDQVIRYCNKTDIHLIYPSSIHVFSDSTEEYIESSHLDPINSYGLTKALSEKYIIRNLKKYTILRLDGVISNTSGLFIDIATRGLNGIPTEMYVNTIRSFLRGEDLAETVEFVMNNSKFGVYNLRGPKSKTMYEWGIDIANKFEFNKDLIVATHSRNIHDVKRVILNIDKAKKELMFNPKPIL